MSTLREWVAVTHRGCGLCLEGSNRESLEPVQIWESPLSCCALMVCALFCVYIIMYGRVEGRQASVEGGSQGGLIVQPGEQPEPNSGGIVCL